MEDLRRFLVRSTLVVGVLCCVWLPRGSEAQEGGRDVAEQAREHYEKGSELYGVGRYEDAVRELQEAYRLSGESVLLYNIAKSFEKLGEYVEAIRHYQDYLDLSANVPEDDRAAVERSIEELEQKRLAALPELTIRTTPAGAKVYLDTRSRIAGQSPFKTRVEIGTHKLFIEKKGFEPIEKEFAMTPGNPLVLDFELRPFEEFGEVQLVANVDGARIFLDGKNIGITPYRDTPKLKVGRHQVILERDGFYRWMRTIEVVKGRRVLVDALMVPVEKPSGAPSTLGWTSVVLGTVGLLAGYAANVWIEGNTPWTSRPLFNDTDLFYQLSTAEQVGFIGGASLLAIGTTLLIYDGVRELPDPDGPAPSAGIGSAPLLFSYVETF